jgi:hypothetical protein
MVLKLSGRNSIFVIQLMLQAISLCNGLLLFVILRRILQNKYLPVVLSLVYLLSPATILFENEVFYTGFVSFLLLSAAYAMLLFNEKQSRINLVLVCAPLLLVCLTRSIFHLCWLLLIVGILMYFWQHKRSFKKVCFAGMLSIAIVGGWYVKNLVLFDNFSASSWVGMNLARIVFLDKAATDTGSIASIPPFMPVSYYNNFTGKKYKTTFAGMNDPVLLHEFKNGRYLNLNNAGYIEISKKYLEASLRQIQHHPLEYSRKVFTAFIIFFTPASSYFQVAENAGKIKFYDLVYSFNPATLFKDENIRKPLLVLAAVPKFLAYLFTFFIIVKERRRSASVSMLNVFLVITILFSLLVSSFLEYGENMRFRYELEPLFLILFAQALDFRFRKKY